MLEPWRTAKVIKIEQATPSTRRFWLEVQDLERFDFKPGQFVTLDLPIHEQKNKRWRSYSIASWPNGTNVIELVIVLLQGGLGTTYLFNEVSVGGELTLRGPQGVFTLQHELDRDLYLICTGTGIAPFRAMVNYIHEHAIPHKNIYLIFGTRTLPDSLYADEMQQLENELQGFNYYRAFSQETDLPAKSYSGYVHVAYEDIISRDKQPAYFFLCGWKEMIDEAKQKIQQLGYDRKDIHLELYG